MRKNLFYKFNHKSVFFVGFIFLSFLCSFFMANNSFAQSRFWVPGGDGNWSSTTNWSATSGGASGASVPTATDDVFFDAASGGAGYTVTLDAPSMCRAINSTGTNAMTLAGGAANSLTVYGNMLLTTDVTPTFTGKLIFDNNSGVANTINTNNITLVCPVEFGTATTSGGWNRVGGAFITASTVTLIKETFNTTGGDCAAFSLSTNSASTHVRSLIFSGTNFFLTGTGTVLDFDNDTNFTLSALGAIASILNAANVSVQTGNTAKTLPTLNFNAAGGTATINTSTVAANTISFQAINNAKTTLTVTGTGSSAYTGAIALPASVTASFGGNNATFTSPLAIPTTSTVNFNNTGTNTFASTISVATGSTVAFSNNGNTYNGVVTINAASNWRFSGTGISTANQNFVLGGTCIAPPTNYVNILANSGTADVRFTPAQTWGNATVNNINAGGGAAITVNPGTGAGNTNVTFPTTVRNLFWVGGTGSWADPLKWSSVSGGLGGQCIPTVNDNVFFDVNSGAAGFITTIPGDAFCRTLNFNTALDFALTIPVVNTLEISGGCDLTATGTVDLTGFLGTALFSSNLGLASPYNINTNNLAFGAITFDAGSNPNLTPAWLLTSDVTSRTVDGGLQLNAGTLNTNNRAITTRLFSVNTVADAVRTLTLGSSAVTITGAGAAVVDFRGNTANFTLNAGTSVFTFTTIGTAGLNTGTQTKTIPALVFTNPSTVNITTPATANTITFNAITVTAGTTFNSIGNSPKTYSGAVSFAAGVVADFNGNSTFANGISFPAAVSTITFNNNVTTATAGTFAVGNAASTITFAGTNLFGRPLSMGTGVTTSFNGANTNTFNGVTTFGVNNAVTFAIANTACTFGATSSLIVGAGSTIRFMANAATTTFNATATITLQGSCASRVIMRSTTNGTPANINFGVARTVSNVNVADISAVTNILTVATPSVPVNPNLGGNNANVVFGAVLSGRNLFWVGKNNPNALTNTLWSVEDNWSLTSNGVGGECIPTINDNVTFDAQSFSATINIVTVDVVNAFAKTMTWTAATNTPTFAAGVLNVDLTLGGNLTMVAGGAGTMVNSFNTLINFTVSTLALVGNPKTITSNAKTFACNFNFNNAGDTWKFQDNFVTSLDVTLTSGTLSTVATTNPARNFTARRFNSNPAGDLARTLELATAASTGTTVFTVTGNSATVMDLRSAANNMTLTALSGANLSTIAFAASNPAAGGTYTVETGTAKTFANFNFTHTAAVTATVNTSATGTNSFRTMTVANLGAVTFTGASDKTIATALNVNTPNGANGFVMNGNTTVSGTANFLAASRTTFVNNATFDTNVGTVTFGNTVFANFTGTLNVTGRSMTFGTNATVNMAALNFTSTLATAANLTFGTGSAATPWVVSGAATFNNAAGQTADVVLGNTVTARFCAPTTCVANNVFRNFTVGTTCSITFGNTGTSDFQLITIGGNSAWRFSVGGITSFNDMVLSAVCVTPIIFTSNIGGTCALIKAFANQSWTDVQVTDISRSTGDPAFPGTITVISSIVTNCASGIVVPAGLPRTLYWVAGGTGNWGSTTNWATSTGGTPGECIPTINDDVIFDANSGGTGYNVTMDVAGQCRTMDWTATLIGATASNAATFTMNNELTVAGNLALPANMTIAGTGTGSRRIVFRPTSGVIIPARTIRTNGRAVDFMDFRDFNTTVGSWTLQDALTLRNVNIAVGNTNMGVINLLGGTLITNNFAVNVNAINVNPSSTVYTYSSTFNAVLANPAETDRTRTLTLGSSIVSIAANDADLGGTPGFAANTCIPLDLQGNSANFTINAGTSDIRFLRAGGTITVNMGTEAKTLFNYTQVGVGTTMNLNTTNVGPHVFNNCNFANNTVLTVTGTSLKTYNLLNFGNTTTSTFNGQSTVTTTTTYGTATTTTFAAIALPVNAFHIFNGAVSIGSTVANLAIFNDSNFKSTFTCSVAGTSLTRFVGNCLFEGAVTYNGLGSQMNLRDNNTFLSTAPLAFTASACVLTSIGGVSTNRNNVFGSTITFSAATVNGRIELLGGGDFKGAVSMLGSTNTFNIGADLNRANLFRAAVVIAGDTNIVNVLSATTAANVNSSLACFLSTINIGGATGGPPTTLATIPNVTFAGRTFFRDNTTIGVGSPSIPAGTYNITFDDLMEWVATPAVTPAATDLGNIVNNFIAPMPTFVTTAGKLLSIGNDNRVQMLPNSITAGVNCTFRNVTFGDNCLFTVQNTGGGATPGHTFDVLTFDDYDVVEFPSVRSTAPNIVDPTITINDRIVTLVNCTAWVKIATVEANRRVIINYSATATANAWTNVIMQDLHIRNNGAAAPNIVTCTDCQPTSNVLTSGGTITFIGILPTPARYFWVGRSLTSCDWTDPANWSSTDGGPSQSCVPSANDDVFFTSLSFTNAFNRCAAVNIDVNFVFCRSMTWIPAGGHPDYLLPVPMGACDVTVPRLVSNIGAPVAVPSPATIQVYGNLYLPQTAVANAFDGIFEFTGGGNGRINTISSPGTAEFFGPVVFNSSDIWEITDRWDSNNDARGSVTINYGTLRAFCTGNNFIFPSGTGTCTTGGSLPVAAASAKPMTLTGDFTINLPVDPFLAQARFESGEGAGGIVTFDGANNPQNISFAIDALSLPCTALYGCVDAAAANSCVTSPFNNLVVNKVVNVGDNIANKVLNVNTYTITLKRNFTILSGDVRDNGNQIRGNPTGQLFMGANTILRLTDDGARSTVFPTCYTKPNINLQHTPVAGQDGYIANSMLTLSNISNAPIAIPADAADLTNASATVLYASTLATNQYVSSVPDYANLIIQNQTKFLDGATLVNGSLIVRTGTILNDMGFQITGNNRIGGTPAANHSRIRLDGTAILILGTPATPATYPTNVQIPIGIGGAVGKGINALTAIASTATTFPTFTPLGNVLGYAPATPITGGYLANGKMELFAGGTIAAGSTVRYEANANQQVQGGFSYGNLTLTNTTAATTKTVTGGGTSNGKPTIGNSLTIGSNVNLVDDGLQIHGLATAPAVGRINMDANSTLTLGTPTLKTVFPTFVLDVIGNATTGQHTTPNLVNNANARIGKRFLDVASLVIYNAGDGGAQQRVDGGTAYGNLILRNSSRATANSTLGSIGAAAGDLPNTKPVTKILDAAMNGIQNNFTIDTHVNFFDMGAQVNLAAANTTSIFTMNKFSVFHIGSGTAIATTFPTNYNARTDRRVLHVTSTIAYDASIAQTVAGGNDADNDRPRAANNTNFIYGSLLLASPGAGTMQAKTTLQGTLYVGNKILIRNNANLIDNQRQIIGNYNATLAADFTRTGATRHTMAVAMDSIAGDIGSNTNVNPDFVMEAGSQISLGGLGVFPVTASTRNTTFPLLYPAADISLAPTSTVVYQARTANNSIQYLAGGITYGNLALLNNGLTSTFTTNKDIGYNTAPVTANMATGGAAGAAWEPGANAFLTTVPTTLTTAAPSFLPLGPVTIAGRLFIARGNRFRDQAQQITGNNTAGNSLLMERGQSAGNIHDTEFVLGTAATATAFPNQFATINLSAGALGVGNDVYNTVIYNSGNGQNANIVGQNTAATAFTYGNLTLTNPTVSGTVTKSLSHNIDVDGNLNIGAFNTLDVTASFRDISLGGSWTNAVNGIFTERAGGTVTFRGSTTIPRSGNIQSVTTQATATTNRFYNVTLNNTNLTGSNNRVRIQDVVRLRNTLTFVDGYFINAANALPTPGLPTAGLTPIVRFDAGSSVVGGAYTGLLVGTAALNNSHVMGAVSKIGNTDFAFPVGEGTLTTPIAISNLSGNLEFTAAYYDADASPVWNAPNHGLIDNTLYGISRVEMWKLLRTEAAGTARVTLSWDNARSSVVAVPPFLVVAHWRVPTNSIWTSEGNASFGGTAAKGSLISVTNVDNFSSFTLGTINRVNILPVRLISFTATPRDKKVVDVRWETVEEKNNSYYVIEKSIDGTNFASFKTVFSKGLNGNSANSLVYTEVDDRPYKGTSYYRLRQTDIDGTTTYSRIVAVNFEGEGGIDAAEEGFILYPNPNDGTKVNLKLTGANFDKAQLAVVDMLGRTVYELEVDKQSNLLVLDILPKLASGKYVLKLVTETKTYAKSFIVE
jgi:trimeric autotransporter adhesin